MTPVGRAVIWPKKQCESCLAIDMKNLAKWADMEQNSRRTLTWSYGSRVTDSVGVEVFAGREILIHYTLTDRWTKEKKTIENWVMIESTQCFYGGKRWWFLCPNCERRCRVLYLPPDQTYFSCRICHNLCYRSEQVKRSLMSRTLAAIMSGDTLVSRYNRARSPRRRAKIGRQLRRMLRDMVLLVDKHGRRRRAKK